MFADPEEAGATGQRVVHVFKCPACGQENRVAEGRQGKRIKCSACENRFVSAAAESIAALSSKPSASSTGRGEPTLWERVFPDPSTALEGSFTGAVGGICAGVFGPIAVGILSGQSLGQILGKLLIGFMVGFGVGAFLGAILGGRVRRGQPDFRIEPGWTVAAAGALTGSVVGMIVERFWWFPVIAATGAVGANFWPRLRRWLESAVNVSDHMNLEDDLVGEGGEGRNGRPYDGKETGRSSLF